MRGWTLLLIGLVACGGTKRAAKDPTDEPPPTQDETPRWEGAAPPEETKPKAAGSTVNEAPGRRADQYDKEATEVVLARAARQVKENCGAAKDEDGKASGPWGKATVQVQLGHNGRSKGVTIPSPFEGKVTGRCIEKAFSNLMFPPWGGSDTTVDWEVEVVEPAGAGKKP